MEARVTRPTVATAEAHRPPATPLPVAIGESAWARLPLSSALTSTSPSVTVTSTPSSRCAVVATETVATVRALPPPVISDPSPTTAVASARTFAVVALTTTSTPDMVTTECAAR